jgi:hypothetical protein
MLLLLPTQLDAGVTGSEGVIAADEVLFYDREMISPRELQVNPVDLIGRSIDPTDAGVIG